ncbi:MAG: hypothetical protein DI534_12505 [Leifsonia xyli]|nr:MAG: hypothetical protein DI534_12505 [Leifsonia xyli]
MAISTEEEFDELERAWRRQLSGLSLVVEASIDPGLAIEALKILGSNIERYTEVRRARLFAKYPAILAAGLCAVASEHYDAGAFWSRVPRGLNVDGNRQQETGKAFQKALTLMGLSRFTTKRTYVGEFLMHAGVPLSSIPDLVRVLLRSDSGHTSGDGAGFVRWASSMSQHVAVTRGFDVPTWTFITQGGEIAEDLIDRVLLTIDHPHTAHGLSAAMAESIAATLEFQSARPSGRRSKTADITPFFTYRSESGVRLRLPPVEHVIDSAVNWHVLLGGESKRIAIEAPWPDDPIEIRSVPIRSPQPTVHVRVSTESSRDQAWDLPLISAENPLLAFDGESGQLIPTQTSLPRSTVWLAFPADNTGAPEDALDAAGDLVVMEHGSTPHGWTGWAFALVDASKLSKVRLRSVDGVWRYTSTIERPHLVGNDDHHSYLTTKAGERILRSKPRLMLPGPSGHLGEIQWTVVVSSPDETELFRSIHSVAAEFAEVSLFADDVVLGDFVVTVRGPLGRGATIKVAVAEGFETAPTTPFRWMSASGAGLEHASVIVRDELAGTTKTITFGATQLAGGLTLDRGRARLPITAQIPYQAVGFAGKGSEGESFVPLLIDTEGLRSAVIRARVPSGAGAALVCAVLDGQVLQTVESGSGWGPTRSFNLAVLAGTLESSPSAELRLVVDERSTPIAFVRPRRLATNVTVDEDGYLRLEGKADVDGLVAYIYPEFARWNGPDRVEVPTGANAVALAEEIRNEGRATIVLAVDNPWVPASPPPRPDKSGGNAFSVKVGTLVESDDPHERGFRAWLAGVGPCPSHSDSLPIALQLYAQLPYEERPEVADRMRTEIAEAVRVHRSAVLPAILRTNASLDDFLRLLVEGDVVTVPREDWESSDELWSLAPGLGVIADSDEIHSSAAADFRANIESAVGIEGLQILDEGTDPHARVGRFDENASVIAKMPDEQFNAMWHEVALVPKALLDQDSRVLATKELLKARGDRGLLVLKEITDELLEFARGALVADLGPRALAPIEARVFRKGMGDIPAVSLALALLARAAARSKSHSMRMYEHVREGYAKLAAAAPKIVQQDLALAELWITHWEDIK